jgi:HTH-type transcriptional regulator / antitoxin HipB
MDAKEIGRIVHFHRKRSGLSREAFAMHAGVGKTVVYDVEKGKPTVQLDTLLRILHTLNIRLVATSPLMHLLPPPQNSVET